MMQSRMNQSARFDRSVAGSSENFSGRLAIQQRVLPAYRAAFFDALAVRCQDGLSVFAGLPQADESIAITSRLDSAKYVPARNLHIGRTDRSYYTCWQRNMPTWLENWQPDVLIVEANPRYLSTLRAVQWMHARKRPVLGWGLGAPKAASQRQGLFAAARRSFYRMFDGMIAYSRRGASDYAALGIPSSRIYVAPNAVSYRPQGKTPSRPDFFAVQPVVLYVGRLQARKRLDNLLYACSTLPQPLQPRLIIVGDGPSQKELHHLRDRIYPQAEFPGDVRGQELASFFTQADLFVLPGTGGLAVQQAMGYGLPVIAAEGDGSLDDLVGHPNGWRVPPNNLPALRSALQEALSNPARLRRMGRESYRIVCDEANIEMMVAGFLKAIGEVSKPG